MFANIVIFHSNVHILTDNYARSRESLPQNCFGQTSALDKKNTNFASVLTDCTTRVAVLLLHLIYIIYKGI